MTNTILNKQSLPEILIKMINTDRVLLQERDGEIRIFPLQGEEQVVETFNGFDKLEAIRQKRLTFKGSMKGKIQMSDDFDEPLEEMREYME